MASRSRETGNACHKGLASITKATPTAAPPVRPNTPGPAKGLWNVVCINRPEAASPAPAAAAVSTSGRRTCSTIMRTVSSPLPARASPT